MASILAVFALAAAACGGSSGNPLLTDGGLLLPGLDGGITGGGCSYTLSGAVTKTGGTCTVDAVLDSGKMTLAFVFAATDDSALTFEADTSNTTTFSAGTFTAANVTKAAGGYIDSSKGWVMNAHNGSNPDQGTFSLMVSSTGTPITNGQGSVWPAPHGTLTETLAAEASSNATGTIMVQVTF